MGNEQSSSGAGPTSSPSTFSFLSNRASVKKAKGIVTVSDGSGKVSTVEEDENYKRFKEIPRFLPILPLNKKGPQVLDPQNRMSSRPIFKFCLRIHEHLTVCGKYITTDQASIMDSIRKVDKTSVALTNNLVEKQKSHKRFLEELQQLPSLNDEIMRIQVLLEELVPVAETLNELLVPEERLADLNLGRVLERTPATSTESSLQSTPRRTPRDDVPGVKVIPVVDKE